VTAIVARQRSRVWRWTKIAVRGLLAWTLLLIFVVGGLTLVRLIDAPVSSTERPVGGGDVVAHAADYPGACHRYGPLSYRGAGYYWECYGGFVRPDGTGTTDEFGPDELTPADDLAHPVGAFKDHKIWRRAVDHPYGFLGALGAVVIGAAGAVATKLGWLRVLSWFAFLPDPHLRPPDEPGAPVRVRVPVVADAASRRAARPGAVVVMVGGLAMIAASVTMSVAMRGLGDVGGFGRFFAYVFAPIGLVVLALVPYAHRRLVSPEVTEIVVAEGGIWQPVDEHMPLVIPWAVVERLVLDEYVIGSQVACHLTLSGGGREFRLLSGFRTRSSYGFLLSPVLPADEARRLAEAFERYRPGHVRWPAREVRRGGFGIVRAVKRTIVRWKVRQ
jgi:hypothetical protein